MRDVVGGVDAATVRGWFAEVAQLTRSSARPSDGRGVTRSSYGAGEDEARRAVAAYARDLGLPSGSDAAGNLLVTAPGAGGCWPRSPVVVGSHLDSVPRGGNYDGLAGVIAAVLVVAEAHQRGARVPVVGLGLRGEESAWFGKPYLGSRALLGQLSADDLRRRHPGLGPDLQTALRLSGADVDRIGRGERLLPSVREFWELHIEQGPVLLDRGLAVGVVDVIRGSVRAPAARVLGQAGHSGTTPHELRKDAVLGFAHLLVDVDRERSLTHGDLTVTCGVVGTVPERHAMTTIADEVRFALDIRSTDDDVAEGLFAYARGRASRLVDGGDVDWGEVVRTPSATMHPGLVRRAKESAENLGTDYLVMPSGAGHDAAVFAGAGIPSGMVFVRNEHGSHNPDEHMEIEDFLAGVRVLAEAVLACPVDARAF